MPHLPWIRGSYIFRRLCAAEDDTVKVRHQTETLRRLVFTGASPANIRDMAVDPGDADPWSDGHVMGIARLLII
jgi:hypothetical protein